MTCVSLKEAVKLRDLAAKQMERSGHPLTLEQSYLLVTSLAQGIGEVLGRSLAEDAREVCWAIELCPASEEQTFASITAAALHSRIESIVGAVECGGRSSSAQDNGDCHVMLYGEWRAASKDGDLYYLPGDIYGHSEQEFERIGDKILAPDDMEGEA